MKAISIALVLTLCLTSAAAMSQTPAQDRSNIATDQQELADAQAAVQADQLKLSVDERAGNQGAIQADENQLLGDNQAITDAQNKLQDDQEDLHTDKERFR